MSSSRRQVEPPTDLNLGCGSDRRADALNVDQSLTVNPDCQIDLDDRPWPLPDDHFKTIEARHVLEHLAEPLAAVGEICRVAAPGATVILSYPIGHTRFEDPQHTRAWTWHTAETLAAEREHSHEHAAPLKLNHRQLNWSIPTAGWRTYVRWRLWRRGHGPWISQIPGLSGEVIARYSVAKARPDP